MNKQQALKLIPASGFLKVAADSSVVLSKEQRAALIRKGNQFFNLGDIEKAKRIFLTTSYSDGLIRIGQKYEQQNRHVEALRMYWLAPAADKRDALIETMASIVRKWLKETERKQ
jgi:hypothetical protein